MRERSCDLADTAPKPHLSAVWNSGGTVAKLVSYLPALLWAALLLFIGGRSDVPTVETDLPLDKAAHLLAYGLLGALLVIGWRRARRPASILWLLAVGALVGAADELHQRVVPGRSADVFDWLADVFGIGVAALLALRSTRGSANVV